MVVADMVHGPKGKPIVHWAAKQAYLALGNLVTSAALLGIDTCPMEGIDPTVYDEVLALQHSGYQTAVVCALGYRHPGDRYASRAKVRFPAQEIIHHVGERSGP
jgi:nitroreductase